MAILLLIMVGLFVWYCTVSVSGTVTEISSHLTSVKSRTMAQKNPPVVLPHALHIPGINKLAGKRVILASGSPRRKEILQIFVRSWVLGSRFEKITCGFRRASPPKSYLPSLLK